jgi:hypothetical protein
MPRYFFNIHHDKTDTDLWGEELPDRNAAWIEAAATAGQMLRDNMDAIRTGRDWKMEVTDEFRNPLFLLQITAKRLV